MIDLGLSLGRSWLDEGPGVIAELRAAGFALSIDTLDPDEILMADEAGVQYVLSLNGSNRHLAERLSATPVLIPDTPEDLDSLDATIAHLERLGKPYLVDPIIEPIGSGSRRASAATSRCAGAIRTPRCSWASATSRS